MDAQQELFTELLLKLKEKGSMNGYEVFDGVLPPEGTAYPFVYLADFRQTDNNTKTEIIGTVYPTIHVWSNNPRNRGTVSSILADIKAVCRAIRNTANYGWMATNVTSQILPDNTTKTPLLHGVVEADMKFS